LRKFGLRIGGPDGIVFLKLDDQMNKSLFGIVAISFGGKKLKTAFKNLKVTVEELTIFLRHKQR
jgi:hypothetical protein